MKAAEVLKEHLKAWSALQESTEEDLDRMRVVRRLLPIFQFLFITLYRSSGWKSTKNSKRLRGQISIIQTLSGSTRLPRQQMFVLSNTKCMCVC